MVKAKKFVLRKHFDGFPKPDDLELVEEELPPLKDGGKTHSIESLDCIFVCFHFRIFS